MGRVTHYRWAYSPTTADVNLSHNEEGHPVDIRLHSDLAQERPERDLLYGYAIRTANGWNIFDDNHKSIIDPNMLWKIREAIANGVGS